MPKVSGYWNRLRTDRYRLFLAHRCGICRHLSGAAILGLIGAGSSMRGGSGLTGGCSGITGLGLAEALHP